MENINDTLKDHAIAVEDWGYRELAQLTYEWAERFNHEFNLGIETPAIQIDQIPLRAIGTYRHGRNGFGLRHEITFNTAHLHRPFADHLKTLLHELLHEWQDLHGKPGKSGEWNYHNQEFRAKAKSYGLIIDEWGHTLGVIPGPFTELLEKYGVDTEVLSLPKSIRRVRGQSKMKKWSCGCTNVRAAVELEAKCLKCGNQFQRAEASW